MRSHLLVLAALGLALGGCSKEPKQSKVWKCQELGVPGGETLSCTQQALTEDGTGVSLTNDGIAPPLPVETTTTGGAGSESGGTSTGSSLDSDSTTASGTTTGGAGSYYCTAGSVDCPPVAAHVGINSESTSASGDTTGGAGSTTGGSSLDSDGTSSTGDGAGTGGGGGGKGGDKDDAKGEEGGGAASGPSGANGTSDSTSSTGKGSGSGGGETYRCEKKNGRVDCTKTNITCEEGLTASGGYCSADGTSSSTSSTGSPSGSTPSTTGDGSTTTKSSTPSTPTSNGKTIGLTEVTTHPDGTKTWTYEVCEVSGHDLSNWVLGIGSCQVVSSSPSQGFEKVSSDPNSGLSGVKWNTGEISGCKTYSVTTVGGTQTMISVSAKASTNVAYGYVAGPKCD